MPGIQGNADPYERSSRFRIDAAREEKCDLKSDKIGWRMRYKKSIAGGIE